MVSASLDGSAAFELTHCFPQSQRAAFLHLLHVGQTESEIQFKLHLPCMILDFLCFVGLFRCLVFSRLALLFSLFNAIPEFH